MLFADNSMLLTAAAAVAALCLAVRLWRSSRGRGTTRTASSAPEKHAFSSNAAKDRAPGEWTPVKFDYPRVEPCKAHFSQIAPVPYRPFRWGEYHVTMGIRSMPWDEWIELDREFPLVHRICEYRIRTRGDRLLFTNAEQPGVVQSAHAAARELVYELAEYLSRRHPDVYSVTRRAVRDDGDENGWYGEGRIETIAIAELGKTYDLEKEDPIMVAKMLMQEDFAIMIEGSDGRYYLQGAAVCIAGWWHISEKMGMPLEDIHLSGNVAQFASKLQLSMDRYFRRLPVDKPIARHNYTLQIVGDNADAPADTLHAVDANELAWATTMKGPEVSVAGGHGLSGLSPEPLPERTVLRVERQTLRRLPRTGAIVFTIRVYQTPIEELAREPGVPGRMASAFRGWPEDVAKYKGRAAFEDILPYLDKCHAEQLAQGIVGEEEKDSDYPY